MQYFNYLTPDEKKSIFYVPPQEFDGSSPKDILSYALGATLYMPATKENISQDLIQKKNKGSMSMVICLEDAIGDKDVEQAENNVCNHLEKLSFALENGEINIKDLPLMFLRIRNKEQLDNISDRIGKNIKLLTGFVFPKFSWKNGKGFFESLKRISKNAGKHLYGMPILETEDILYKETRIKALNRIRNILDTFYDYVLNVRVGATDFSSIFGLRRGYYMTIYDIAVIRDCISDILNYFTRIDRNYVVAAPVWEYFSSGDRVLKPQLRISPFEKMHGKRGIEIRKDLLDAYIDGLIREVLLDKANGFTGKTIIHPSHIIPVQSLYVVSHEEYMDALSIIENDNGSIGVMKSKYENKMNEIKPHLNWANKIMKKSKIYGVYHERQNFTSLLTNEVYL